MRMNIAFNDDGTFTSDSIDAMRAAVDEVLDGKTTLIDALEMTPEQFEALYAVGYNTYMAGKYEDAGKLFGLLVALQPYDARIFMGLGASLQMLRRYEVATFFYQWASGIDQQDPAPMLLSAECFLADKDVPGAKSALKYALQRAADNPAHTALRAKAEVMLANIQD